MRAEKSVIHTPTSGSGVQPRVQGQAPGRGLVAWLSGALVIITVIAAAITLAVPEVLTGPAAMNGSARGTALVVLAMAMPTLVVSVRTARDGSVVATAVWLGALGYLTYNSVMFVFATPYNRLFLLYVAMLSLSFWTTILLTWRALPAVPTTTVRWGRPVAGYLWLIAALNALLWISTIGPSIVADRPGAVTDGLGVATNPVFVQDLAIWLPAAALAALGLWRRRPWGALLSGAVLVFWFIESIGIAVDQWFGSTADPASTVTSMTMVPAFAALAVVDLVPLLIILRSQRGRDLKRAR
jgi:hypothetical protein